ncbi:MAG TPA: hypothetical protein VFW19_13910 [Allosphingosinicella sp.]|nr:hypothetical protein [Allosphingosinicella sp.]
MKPIIIVMLCVQALFVLVAIFSVLKKPNSARSRPIWSSLAIGLILAAATSFDIADKHRGADGSELLEYGSGVMLGMAILSLLVLLRQRLGTDSAR